jgi:hypothetical protein
MDIGISSARVDALRRAVSHSTPCYNISVPIFGGFAPFVASWLIELTGSKLAPSFYLIATALLSVAALVALRRRLEV